MQKRAVILLANGFEEIEAVATIDILRRAKITVVIASVDGEFVTGANGVTIKTDCSIKTIDELDFDAIILPGGYKGTMRLCEDIASQTIIKNFNSKDKIIAAICAAPLALDKAKVLKAEYTCYPGVEDGIKSSMFVGKAVVESGNVITSRGPGTAICFGLYLVEKLAGEEMADSIKRDVLASYC